MDGSGHRLADQELGRPSEWLEQGALELRLLDMLPSSASHLMPSLSVS